MTTRVTTNPKRTARSCMRAVSQELSSRTAGASCDPPCILHRQDELSRRSAPSKDGVIAAVIANLTRRQSTVVIF